MKTNTLLIFCALFSNLVFAQSPDWYWANSGAGDRTDVVRSIIADGSGNVIAVGDYFSTSITFGATTLTNPLTSNSYNLFVVKYDAAGNALWARSAGRDGADGALAVATDASGNIIVVGSFGSDTIDFGSNQFINHALPGCFSGCGDMYIVKYDPAGNVLWANSAGGSGADNASGIVVDAAGNYLVAGSFSSTSITFGSTTLTNLSGNADPYYVKYDPAGNVIWAQSYNGTVTPSGKMVFDGSGNIFVAGTFVNASVTWGTSTLINAGGNDYFIGKLDSTGNQLWAQSAGGIANEGALGVSVDLNGNIVVLGNFTSPSITLGTTTLSNPPNGASFRATYDTAGNVLNANTFAEDNSYYSWDMASTTSGNFIAAGSFFNPTIIIGSDTLVNNGIGLSDVVVACYDSTGMPLWAKSAGSTGSEMARIITIDLAGNIIVSGSFSSPTINFGPTTLINASSGATNLFFAKLDTLTITGNKELITKTKDVLLFPNPATGRLTISLKGNKDNVKVTITNISGKLVYTSTDKETHSIEVEVADFAEGVYFVNTLSRNFSRTEKLIVAR